VSALKGGMVFAVIPNEAYYRATLLVSAMTPPLEAE
jgi:hypothetical protein